jgi:D-aminopeptidase
VRAAAERAVRRASAGELEPLVVATPITVEVDYHRPIEADYASIVPGAERVGDRGVRYVTSDMASAYRAFLAGVRLAGICD